MTIGPYSLLPENLPTLEISKFELDSSGYVQVRTSAKGTFTPSGLTTDGKITVMSISTTAVKIPSTPLANRNSMSVHNKSNTLTLYIGFDNGVTADDTSTGGWEIPPGGFFNTDITDNIEIWGISTGSITIKVLELA